jgi:DNA-binding NtrC family response regulator
MSRRAQAVLARYNWPGNVRELENVIGDAAMNVAGDTIDVRDLPERLRAQAGPGFEEDEGMASLADLERRHARRVLQRCNGNKVRAAEVLGISRATLYRLLGEPGDEPNKSSQAKAQ